MYYVRAKTTLSNVVEQERRTPSLIKAFYYFIQYRLKYEQVDLLYRFF